VGQKHPAEWKNNEENRDMEKRFLENPFPLHWSVNGQHHCCSLAIQASSSSIEKSFEFFFQQCYFSPDNFPAL